MLRVLNRFALVAAAGTLATELDITGWPREEAFWAVGKCFDAWLQSRGHLSMQEEVEILRQIKRCLEQHGEARFTVIGSEVDTKTMNRWGYRKEDGIGSVFFVFQESFKQDMCTGFDAQIAAKVLKEKGWLVPDTEGKSTRAENLPCSDSTTRCYRLNGSKIFSDDI